MKMPKPRWKKVVFAADCLYEDWDEYHEFAVCPKCKTDYAECGCPGPTQDGYEYKEIKGELWARAIE